MTWTEDSPVYACVARAADLYGVDAAVIFSRERTKYIAKARHEAMHQLSELGLSSVEIGKFLNRDHSTVLYALKKGRAA